jgi:plasmid stability protein
MASLTIKDIPDEVYEGFRRAAAVDRRSLNQEAIEAMALIARTAQVREDGLASLERLRKIHERMKPSAIDAVEALQEDRDR